MFNMSSGAGNLKDNFYAAEYVGLAIATLSREYDNKEQKSRAKGDKRIRRSVLTSRKLGSGRHASLSTPCGSTTDSICNASETCNTSETHNTQEWLSVFLVIW
jgi:hypothetical protein